MSIRDLSLCSLALLACSFDLGAQTEVRKYNATADTGYGVVYRLPRTELEVVATIAQYTYTPGLYAAWSEKYLGREVVAEAETRHEILNVEIRSHGVPDPNKQYLVAFDKRTIAPFLSLAPGNLIYSINGQSEPTPPLPISLPAHQLPDRAMPALPREYSLATSEAKQAELAAAYLYEVREASTSILTGGADNMPKDGEAMRLVLDRLRTEEQRTLRLFVGDTTRHYSQRRWVITPEAEDMNQRTLGHFSPERGLLDIGDQTSRPLIFDLKIVERAPVLSDKERKKQEKLEGIVYNVPGMGLVSVRWADRLLCQEHLPITQAGGTQTMSKKMFNLKDGSVTAVYFDLTTGALVRVVSE